MQHTLKRRENESNISLFWSSVFSSRLFQSDVAYAVKKDKIGFLFGFLYFLILEVTFVSFLFFPILSAALHGYYLKMTAGILFIFASITFACLGIRGYGLCVASGSNRKDSVRGFNTFTLGLFGVILLFLLCAFTLIKG